MRILISIALVLAIIGFLLYQRFKSAFSQFVVSYQILGTTILNANTQLILSIRIFNPNNIRLKITNPQISVFDGNANLLLRLDLQDINKTVYLQQGSNEYNFKIKEKLQFINPLNLTSIKTYFSATIYGFTFSKEIPTNIN